MHDDQRAYGWSVSSEIDGAAVHPAQNDLERYYCQTLAQPRLESVEDHLLACQMCRMRLVSIRRFVDWLVLGAHHDARAGEPRGMAS
jgi:hypothetical protein